MKIYLTENQKLRARSKKLREESKELLEKLERLEKELQAKREEYQKIVEEIEKETEEKGGKISFDFYSKDHAIQFLSDITNKRIVIKGD